jgi:integrase
VVKELTVAAVEKYRPGTKRRRIRDAKAKSLFLVIEPSGTKSWQMRFRTPSGRIGKLTLGRVDFSGREWQDEPQIGQPLSLAAARLLAAKVHRDRERGLDVIADHRARRHRQRAEIEQRGVNTFAAAARMFIEEHARSKTRRWFETARLLGLHPDDLSPISGGMAERWSEKPVREVDGHDVWSVVDEARRVGVPGIAPRTPGLSETRPGALLGALSALFGWLLRNRKIEHNPIVGVHRPSAPKPRERTLTNDEIRWFWQACEAVDAPRVSGAPRPFAPLLRTLLLTGARLNEVAGMRRDELHDDGTWHLSGSRTKNGRPHVVPLPLLARQLIASVEGEQEVIFSTNKRTPPSGWSRMKRRLDAAMLAIARKGRGTNVTIPPWRLHDLRRTAVTGMVELGVPPHVVEQVVNHVSGTRASVAGVYNRSQILPERKAALERWAAHIESIVSGKPVQNILRLTERGRQ